MKRIALLLLALLACSPAQAQSNFGMPPPAGVTVIGAQVVASCGSGTLAATQAFITIDQTGALCSSGSGGGGGGLSVTDQAAWVQGTSKFTPSGCEFNDTSTLSSGTQGTVRCNTKRAFYFDTDTTGSNLYAAVTGPIPAGTNVIGALSANQSVNEAQINGATPLMGNGVSGTGSQRVNIASDNTAFTVNAVLSGSSVDPCQNGTKAFLPITATTSLVKVIAPGVSAKKLYICQINLVVTAADNVAVFEATTGTTCATSAVAVYGAGTSVATAANGYPFPANGGISLGQGGFTVGQTTVNNNDLCIATSAATPLTGGITYVTQ